MNVLIVGAGAVGQVYGRHLALGGARVSYYVREKYAVECRAGLVFYPLNRRRPREVPVRMPVAPDEVLTTIDQVKATAWDQVYLCMASHALRGAWLPELAAAIGDATVVSLQPGSEDRDIVIAAVREDRVVSGMITVISYHAPLAGETVPEPGMAYYFPPMQPAPFSGPRERTRAVVDALKRGGLPCKVARDVPAKVRFPSALLMVLLTALESAQWKLDDLANSPLLARVRPATLEAFAIIASAHGTKAPRMLKMVARPFWLRRLLWVARRMMPFDLETYLRVHFTKVREQTRMFMHGYIDEGSRLGRSTDVLRELEGRVAA
jgi:2-dehydropantoate 2-reductase